MLRLDALGIDTTLVHGQSEGREGLGDIAASTLDGVSAGVGIPMDRLAGMIEQRPMSLLCLVWWHLELRAVAVGEAFEEEPASEPRHVARWKECCPKLPVAN
jgi:hypothetical protein